MKTLRETLAEADSRHVAIGHFNISELEAWKGIFSAALGLSSQLSAPLSLLPAPDSQLASHSRLPIADSRLPILIGVSEGEREFIGLRQAVALVRSFRDTYDYPI